MSAGVRRIFRTRNCRPPMPSFAVPHNVRPDAVEPDTRLVAAQGPGTCAERDRRAVAAPDRNLHDNTPRSVDILLQKTPLRRLHTLATAGLSRAVAARCRYSDDTDARAVHTPMHTSHTVLHHP